MLMKYIGKIEIPAVGQFAVNSEFVVGKNGIKYIDSSLTDAFGRFIVAAQEPRVLVCDVLQKTSLHPSVVATLKENGRGNATLADVLLVLQSVKLDGCVRRVFLVGDYVIRIDWNGGWIIHVFVADTIYGEWQAGRWFISHLPEPD